MQSNYDVIISGAGPAGATLARLLPAMLGREVAILLLESRPPRAIYGAAPASFYPRLTEREKCCGGLLAPDAQSWLKRMGLNLPKEVLSCRQPQQVWTLDLQSGHERYYQRPYINMKRSAFESWLLSLLPAGVDLRFGERLRSFAYSKQNGITVTTRRLDGGETTVSGRVLVGADGAFSLVRRKLGANIRQAALYLAIQEAYQLDNKRQATDPLWQQHMAAFDPRLTDFYGWGIPKDELYLLGIALPMQKGLWQNIEPQHKMANFAQSMQQKGLKLGKPMRRDGTYVLRPALQDIHLGANNVFLIGEAAGWISPSSAEGFSYAFASAHALAESLAQHWSSSTFSSQAKRAYYTKTLALRANIAWKLTKAFAMYTPSLRRISMHLGLDA